MKAGKDNKVELVGKVVQKKFGKGSKSEHEAICLQTDEDSYVLRRLGANPFSDPELQKLVGEKVCATGVINDYLFLASELKKIDD